jgi:protease I
MTLLSDNPSSVASVVPASLRQSRSEAMANISDRKIAVLATDGVELVELTEPVKALKSASAQVVVISPAGGQIQGMNHHEKSDKLAVDHDLASVKPESFEGLVLPGDVDALRT